MNFTKFYDTRNKMKNASNICIFKCEKLNNYSCIIKSRKMVLDNKKYFTGN